MTDNTRRSASGKHDTIAAAKKLCAEGMQVIPVNRKSKRPKGGLGWNKQRIALTDIDKHFVPGDNVGVVWGPHSNWYVDADMDWDECVAVYERLAVSTRIYGRENRPRTHLIYRCKDMASTKWVAPNGSVILELRAAGTQSVMPPSIHPDGDRYVWHNESTAITEILPTALKSTMDRVAAIALLARHYPDGGGRHDFVSAFCGALMRERWSAEDTERAAMALLDGAGSKETDRAQRERTIANTIAHYGEGDKTYGWATLATWVDNGVLKKVRAWLTLGRVSVPIDAGRSSVAVAEVVELPLTLRDPPGLVGEVMKWSARRSYIRQPTLDVAVGLMCTALASMNRFVVAGWNTPLQPYMMLLAPTAGGKDSALNSVYEFCLKIRLGGSCYSGFQSPHAMLDTLAEGDHMAFYSWDEAARKIKGASRPGSPEHGVITKLIEIYGKANASVNGLPARGQPIPTIERPFLVTMAAAQAGQLMSVISDVDMATGVVNRFMLFDTGDETAPINERRDGTFPARITAAATVMRDRPPSADGEFVTINFDNAGYAAFVEFLNVCRRRCVESSGEVWGRAHQNALMVAGILAAGGGGDRPVIDETVARWAIDFIKWSQERWLIRLNGSGNRSRVEGQSKAVEAYITNARSYAARAGRSTQRELLAAGLMTRTMLKNLCRHMTARELDDILDSLKEAELIVEGEKDGITVYWRPILKS